MSDLETAFEHLVRAEAAYYDARRAFWGHTDRHLAIVINAIRGSGRGTALRELEHFPLDQRRKALIELTWAGSFDSGDTQRAWRLIEGLGEEWLADQLSGEIDRILEAPSATYEEFRALGDLLARVAPQFLPSLIDRAHLV